MTSIDGELHTGPQLGDSRRSDDAVGLLIQVFEAIVLELATEVDRLRIRVQDLERQSSQ